MTPVIPWDVDAAFAGLLRDAGEKLCTRCNDAWPADTEFFRLQAREGGARLAPWCRACESDYQSEKRAGEAARKRAARAEACGGMGVALAGLAAITHNAGSEA